MNSDQKVHILFTLGILHIVIRKTFIPKTETSFVVINSAELLIHIAPGFTLIMFDMWTCT